MTDKARYVPVQLLIEAIKKGVARPDPQKNKSNNVHDTNGEEWQNIHPRGFIR
jgi:hypothetical protein